MKKIILALFFIIAFLSKAGAQSLMGSQEWRDLINNLQTESWQDANTKSLSLLNQMPNAAPDDPTAALLRTMYIHSEAGLLNDGKVTQDEAIKAVKGFTGMMIILPGHRVALKWALNTIQLVNEKTDTLFVTETNKKGTDIFAFDYIILNNKWSIEDFKNRDGELYSLGGIIKSITVEGHMLPRFKVIIERGIYQKYE
ncbi:MAG: hypothetical protein JWP37_4511 [Mucilaginibacter sp.]|nr:hypothetical protein [Mucilaginibacter sp.]